MKKIFSKEEAQKLTFADAIHVWMRLDKDYKYNDHWNAFIWNIYKTRLDLGGLSKKNWGLTWDTYGIKWILSTPNNSYDKRNNITIENIECYLETGNMEPIYKVKCKDCGKIFPEKDAEYVTFEDGSSDYICSDCLEAYGHCEECDCYIHDSSETELIGLRGGVICSDCYDEHGWKYE